MDFSSTFSLGRSQSLKPTRRKLQKNAPKAKGLAAKRASADSYYAARNSFDVVPMKSAARQMGMVEQPTIPMPPDLSDSKWLHYLENSGLMGPTPMRQATNSTKESSTTPTIPELSHLALRRSPRESLDNPSATSPTSSASTASVMRRQAKTPVFRIGQLENHASKRSGVPAKKTDDAELIAESYRALLDPEDAQSIHSETQSEPSLSKQIATEETDRYTRRHRSDVPQSIAPLRSPSMNKPLTYSPPSSDNGTLVGYEFEEDTIYFKPVSFSPEPSPPLHHQSFEAEIPAEASSQDNLSLQICTDLLTRELSAAIAERPQRRREVAALQIWVMIEAYERLRDEVTQLDSQNGKLTNLGTIFDTWLSSLYAVHTSLTRKTTMSEDMYEELEEDLD